MKCRPGRTFGVLSAITGALDVSFKAYFVTWIAFMHDEFFKEQFPVPTMKGMRSHLGAGWVEAYGSDRVRYVVVCSEFKMEAITGSGALIMLWSDY